MIYKIRKARAVDAKAIAKVHVRSWRETYKDIVDNEYLKNLSIPARTKKWEESLKKPEQNNWTFLVEDSIGKVVGFITGGIGENEAELYAIYILKKHQKNNLGYRLTKKLCYSFIKHGVKSMFVCVLKDNSSKNFYTKHGAKLFKTDRVKIGNKTLIEEYFRFENFDSFQK